MYFIEEEDIIVDADAAVIDNEMTKILINNSLCPICIGIARMNSNQGAVLCNTCGTLIC
jgi:hypothetical protein